MPGNLRSTNSCRGIWMERFPGGEKTPNRSINFHFLHGVFFTLELGGIATRIANIVLRQMMLAVKRVEVVFFHDIQSKFLSRASLTSTPIRGAGIFWPVFATKRPKPTALLSGWGTPWSFEMFHLRKTNGSTITLSLASCHLFTHVYMMYCIQVQHWSMQTCNLICVELTVKWLIMHRDI